MRSDQVFELAEKIQALRDTLGAGKLDEAFSKTVLGIERTTYRSLVAPTHKGRLAPGTQRCLSEALAPRIGAFQEWPEWIDPDPSGAEMRRDSAESFRNRLRTELAARAQKKNVAQISPARNAPPSCEDLFARRIRQIAKSLDSKEVADGFLLVAWDQLPFAGEVSSGSNEQSSLATRVCHTRNSLKPQSCDARFATLEMRCDANGEQPWPLTLNLCFGPSHPEGFVFGGGQIVFKFAKQGQDARDFGDRLIFPGPSQDRQLQISTNGGSLPKKWKFRVTHSGSSYAPIIFMDHNSMPTRCAITIRSVLEICNVINGEILTASLVIAAKDML